MLGLFSKQGSMAGSLMMSAGSKIGNRSLFDMGSQLKGRPKQDNSDYISSTHGKDMGVGYSAFMGGNASEIGRLNGIPTENKMKLLNSISPNGNMAQTIGGENASIIPNSVQFKGNGCADFAVEHENGRIGHYSVSPTPSTRTGYLDKFNTPKGDMFVSSKNGSSILPGEQYNLQTPDERRAAENAIGMNLDNLSIDINHAMSLTGTGENGYVINNENGDIMVRMSGKAGPAEAEYAFNGIPRDTIESPQMQNTLDGILGSNNNKYVLDNYDPLTRTQKLTVMTDIGSDISKESEHTKYIIKDAACNSNSRGKRHTITIDSKKNTVIFEKEKQNNDYRNRF